MVFAAKKYYFVVNYQIEAFSFLLIKRKVEKNLNRDNIYKKTKFKIFNDRFSKNATIDLKLKLASL